MAGGRPLAAAERAVLDLILAEDFAGVDALRAQADVAVVTGFCSCGCPSIELTVEDDSAPRAEGLAGRLAPVELEQVIAEGEVPANVLLFVDDGMLSYLEYVYYDSPSPTSWPGPERFTVVRLDQ